MLIGGLLCIRLWGGLEFFRSIGLGLCWLCSGIRCLVNSY